MKQWHLKQRTVPYIYVSITIDARALHKQTLDCNEDYTTDVMRVANPYYVYYLCCKPGTTTFNNSIALVINRTCVYVIQNESISCSFAFKLVSTVLAQLFYYHFLTVVQVYLKEAVR